MTSFGAISDTSDLNDSDLSNFQKEEEKINKTVNETSQSKKSFEHQEKNKNLFNTDI